MDKIKRINKSLYNCIIFNQFKQFNKALINNFLNFEIYNVEFRHNITYLDSIPRSYSNKKIH